MEEMAAFQGGTYSIISPLCSSLSQTPSLPGTDSKSLEIFPAGVGHHMSFLQHLQWHSKKNKIGTMGKGEEKNHTRPLIGCFRNNIVIGSRCCHSNEISHGSHKFLLMPKGVSSAKHKFEAYFYPPKEVTEFLNVSNMRSQVTASNP